MQIGELSRLSGVSARSLRYYEQHELITAERGTNNYREYGDDVVQTARNLHLLFELGVGRELARSVLACSGDAPAEVHRATRTQLTEVLNQMTHRIDELSTARDALVQIVEESR